MAQIILYNLYRRSAGWKHRRMRGTVIYSLILEQKELQLLSYLNHEEILLPLQQSKLLIEEVERLCVFENNSTSVIREEWFPVKGSGN